MGELRTFSLDKSDQWLSIVQNTTQYDVYHLPAFHELDDVEGTPRLFVYYEDDGYIAIPLILQDVEQTPGLSKSGREWQDATSVYGYPGPITNRRDPPETMLEGFASAIRTELEQMKVISVFSRLNPLIEQHNILARAGGRIMTLGPTVAIDLRQPLETQYQQYRTNMHRDIRKAREAGAVCCWDRSWQHLEDFIVIYYETMERVGAADRYFFPPDYFLRFRKSLNGHAHLFIVLLDEEPICGGLFTHCQQVIQYHLGGTRTEYRDLAPTKLMFDTVRLWGNEQEASFFHLGGGVGAKRDGLFNFKSGFSNLVLEFQTWQAVLNRQVYVSLATEKRAWMDGHGCEFTDTGFFPIYRHPTVNEP